MKYFQDDTETDNAFFGIVRVGESKEVAIEVKNTEAGKVENLSFSAEGVEIISFPSTLELGATGILTLRYTPDLELRKRFSAKLEVRGEVIV